jgi:lambda repressor-like predicted transcriptional regulator
MKDINAKTHQWVKEALRRKGFSFVDLAKVAGVSASTVYAVSTGRARSAKIETLICATIGYEPQQIWPAWFCQSSVNSTNSKNHISPAETSTRAYNDTNDYPSR